MRVQLSFLLLLVSVNIVAQISPNNIRINQIGYLPQVQKIASITDTDQVSFEIINNNDQSVVFTGQLSDAVYWNKSEEYVKTADFSSLNTPGTYRLRLPDNTISYPFIIDNSVFLDLSKSSIKAFYYNRASMALTPEFAGEYQRPLGHPDDQVVVHASAASAERPAGTVISTPCGWYDAGDYNKYIVNSGISTFSLLSAYENYPDYYKTLNLNIPESNNNIPDILDEALWNIKWMFTMQDPNDGGVYNKTTNANFDDTIMPHEVTTTRYVAAKGTAAALDFTAIMAMSARIYQPYMPDFAAQCLKKAELAWEWAQKNPDVTFKNPAPQSGYPAIVTGGYGDSTFSDEFFWAGAELYITTKNDSYYNTLDFASTNFSHPSWGSTQTLGLLSLAGHINSLTKVADTSTIKKEIVTMAEKLSDYRENSSPYKITINNFGWGSNSDPANQAIILMQAYKLTNKVQYFNAALSTLDYILGRNATSYCFVTGHGTLSPMDIHHRPSAADNIKKPIPGFLAGGPNPNNVKDDCGAELYPSLLPAKAYVDNYCSYSTNEIAINWNGPLVFLSGAIHHTYNEEFNQVKED